jgi:uncharacterized protein YjeT (DUF2065 family)
MYTTDTTIYANLALIGLLLVIMGIAYVLYPSIKKDIDKFKDLN